MTYMTAYFPVVELGRAGPGDFVLVVAGSSSAGLGATQLARLQGARVIATSRTFAKRDFLLQHGAEAVIATGEEDLAARIRELTGGKGVRIVYDPIAGSFVSRYVEGLADNAQIFLYGGLSGEMTVSFPILPVVRAGATVTGYSLINHTRDREQLCRARDFIADALARGALPPPVVDRVFPFAETVESVRYMQSGVQRGKIAVRVVE
jgi:NADPH:quinone reductase-like Zn-dependent oxidoreductase